MQLLQDEISEFNEVPSNYYIYKKNLHSKNAIWIIIKRKPEQEWSMKNR